MQHCEKIPDATPYGSKNCLEFFRVSSLFFFLFLKANESNGQRFIVNIAQNSSEPEVQSLQEERRKILDNHQSKQEE